jgi:resuscitation-promoting factor RpfA
MTYNLANSRSTMTAIAAALAFSSTPLLAQDASAPDPVADTIVETPAPAAPDPLAPEPAAPETTAPTETSSSAAAEPAAKAAKPATRGSVATSATRTTRASAPASTVAPAAAAPAEAPLPVEQSVPPEAPIAEPVAPLAVEPAPAAQPDVMEDLLPIAGGTALGLLLIGGTAMAMRRRKRREEESGETDWEMTEAEAEPVTAAPSEPAFVKANTPIHDPIPSKASVTTLPNGFDISRFGPHVQAAYLGPTPDNPSFSLRNRLTRASFYDQQERRAAETAAARRTTETPAKPDWVGRNDADFMFRRADRKPVSGPAFHN